MSYGTTVCIKENIQKLKYAEVIQKTRNGKKVN